MPNPKTNCAAIVLAAGRGKRLGGEFPKVLLEAAGRPIISYLVATVRAAGLEKIVVVTGFGAAEVEEALASFTSVSSRRAAGSGLASFQSLSFANQPKQLGTGDAVRAGLKSLAKFRGTVVVLCGDAPLVKRETLVRLIEKHEAASADLTMVTVRRCDPTGYGRVLRDSRGEVIEIREEVDSSDAERAIDEVATGLYAFSADFLRETLPKLGTSNRQQEYYLPDLVKIAGDNGRSLSTVEVSCPEEFQGVNTWDDLALVRTAIRRNINNGWMQRGVEIIDPETTFIDADVTMDPPLKILPFTVIEGKSQLGKNSQVGPFAHLRPGSILKEAAHVGNFVEMKKTTLGKGSKANHLSYLGDATIGARVNVGAGTITCNYDGTKKHPTVLGDDVFVGSDTQFVAPVTVGKGAWIGAGATITNNVPPFALAVSRADQKNIKGWARKKKVKG